jgi:hypothetical protein
MSEPRTCRHCGRVCWGWGGACAGRRADIAAGRIGRSPFWRLDKENNHA